LKTVAQQVCLYGIVVCHYFCYLCTLEQDLSVTGENVLKRKRMQEKMYASKNYGRKELETSQKHTQVYV
jgi:hypothetical protein